MPLFLARRILRWTKRIALGLLAVAAFILILGACYQAVVGNVDQAQYPAPGRLIDIGGARLHLHCVGNGSPTVVLEAGLGLGMVTWRYVQEPISQITRVCAYDRAGYGWSEPGALPRTSSRISTELRTLLERAGVNGPYVLVGHSLGGLYARYYAAAHLSDVHGMVLVDSSHEDQGSPGVLMQTFVRAAHLVGTRRLVFRFGDQAMDALYASNQSSAATNEEFAAVAESFDEVRRANLSLGNRPLVVITAGQNTQPNWDVLQRDLLTRSTNSRQIVAEGSGHYVQDDRPALVIGAVRDVVEMSRQWSEHARIRD